MNNKDFGDFLLTSGLKNHRNHGGHRDKRLRSVLSVNSVVDFPCDDQFLLNKLRNLSFFAEV